MTKQPKNKMSKTDCMYWVYENQSIKFFEEINTDPPRNTSVKQNEKLSIHEELLNLKLLTGSKFLSQKKWKNREPNTDFEWSSIKSITLTENLLVENMGVAIGHHKSLWFISQVLKERNEITQVEMTIVIALTKKNSLKPRG